MHLDVQDLRNFYYRGPLGRAAQKVMRDALAMWWPQATGETLVGYGFAVPLLRPYLDQARRVLALMPGPQGVMSWPQGMANISVLVEPAMWPLGTGMVDKLVVLHGLECTDHPGALLDECWRVLGPGGRAVFILPNRAGLWSQSDKTPFGFGQPYTTGQLEVALLRHGFSIERSLSTLYQPPSVRPIWRKLAPLMEGAGAHLPVLKAGGVVMVEVSKQVFAPRGGVTVTRRARLPRLAGVAQPVVRDPVTKRQGPV